MKIIIAGSRTLGDASLLEDIGYSIEELEDSIPSIVYSPMVIVSGTASGIDQLGELWAKLNHKECIRFPAQWRVNKKFDPRAGFKRNEQMAIYSDALLAIWDGYSKGTLNMINMARRHSLKLKILLVED